MAKISIVQDSTGKDSGHWFECPGCEFMHVYPFGRWAFNGDVDKPTFTPSYLQYEAPNVPRCHFFVTDGKIQFLADCTHKLAGQTLEMEEIT